MIEREADFQFVGFFRFFQATTEYKKTAADMYKTVNYVNKVDWTTS